MPQAKKLLVTPEYAGLRLDAFLHAHFLDFSRSWIQKLIKKGHATIDKKKVAASHKLKAGDLVMFAPELPPEISLAPDESLNETIKVIFENDDFLVINKPAGLNVHPSAGEPRGTLVNWLLYYYPPIQNIGESKIRPGIVHRLDKDTSGVMVMAKNQKTFVWLKQQFQNHTVVKKYVALVNGAPGRDNGRIDLNIIRSKSDPTKNATTPSQTAGRKAVTYWQVLHRYPDHTLLEITPQTGRMHQIRVHMKALNMPVAGDKKYALKNKKNPKNIGRMFLHAEYLSLIAPTGEKFSFHAPLPEDLETVLRNLPFVLK